MCAFFLSLRCSSAVGVGQGHRMIVTIGGQDSALSDPSVTFSYKVPTISTVTGNPLDTRGGVNATITGTNFGPLSGSPEWSFLGASVTGSYGYIDGLQYNASKCWVTTAHSQVQFYMLWCSSLVFCMLLLAFRSYATPQQVPVPITSGWLLSLASPLLCQLEPPVTHCLVFLRWQQVEAQSPLLETQRS
jgi:hypothetical protein